MAFYFITGFFIFLFLSVGRVRAWVFGMDGAGFSDAFLVWRCICGLYLYRFVHYFSLLFNDIFLFIGKSFSFHVFFVTFSS